MNSFHLPPQLYSQVNNYAYSGKPCYCHLLDIQIYLFHYFMGGRKVVEVVMNET